MFPLQFPMERKGAHVGSKAGRSHHFASQSRGIAWSLSHVLEDALDLDLGWVMAIQFQEP